MSQKPNPAVAFIGLGAMGISMATHLARSSFPVTGYDINPATLSTLESAGGTSASSPSEAAAKTNASVVIFMVATADHVNSALFDSKNGAVHGLAKNATLIIHSTVPPTMIPEIRRRLASEYSRSDVVLIDAPVSGGTTRASDGTLSIMVSSERPADLERDDVQAVLGCMAATVYSIPGGLGSALSIKALNQVLCGIHIATASEIMGLAAVLGLNTKKFADSLNGLGPNQSAGKGKSWAWMLGDRVKRMLDPNPPLSSAMSIILKDVRIVNAEAERVQVPLRLCNTAQVIFERAVALGLTGADDSSAVEVFLRNGKGDDKMEIWRKASEAGRLSSEEQTKLTKKLEIALAAIYSMASYEALLFAEGMKMCESEKQKKQWYEILASAAAGSTMFINGMPRMLESVSKGENEDVELLVSEKQGILETLKEVVTLAQKSDYTPSLLLVTEQYFQQISDGTFTHRGSAIKLVDDES